MAEAFSLAASAAGLISFGLQVTSGITIYLDAVESRQDELASVKRQNDALAASLNIIKAAAASSRSGPNHHGQAITTSIQSCEAELRAVEALLAALANCDNTATWRQRLLSKKKKLSYVFDRPKVQQVVQRLQSANQMILKPLSNNNSI
ncbi:uncharacterized protein PG986_015077 [Apiospora aurea]|uniref:Fungal N-terminal domain-containing protein n=1 Tax=Apiospora aurea TaxID=335848 RepID=A0ABR1PS03_9PEZI